jgi:surface antigen
MKFWSRRTGKIFSGGLAALFALCLSFPEPVFADPPPWAPAHGYRSKDKHKNKGKHGKKQRSSYQAPREVYYTPDVGIPTGRCNREILGAILGGAAGGYAGSQIGSGSGKLAATAAGAVIGLIVGGSIGQSMDKLDHACIGQVLEQAETGRKVKWVDPDSRKQFNVTPTRTFKTDSNRFCREYISEVAVSGRTEKVHGTACRNLDGSWQLVS